MLTKRYSATGQFILIACTVKWVAIIFLHLRSTLAVASSKTKILLFLSKVLARQNNCLCPTLKLLPPSLTVSSRK